MVIPITEAGLKRGYANHVVEDVEILVHGRVSFVGRIRPLLAPAFKRV
jgi:hypothetical protein